MSTVLQSFRLVARSCRCRNISYRYTTKSIGKRRAFSTTQHYSQEDDAEVSKILDRLSENQRRELESQMEGLDAEKYMEEVMRSYEQGMVRQYQNPTDHARRNNKKMKNTFLNMGETMDEGGAPEEDGDEEFPDADGLTSIAHMELEQHREMRHYARLAAWEMPLLSKMAKPFEPPSADMPLRFRYTTYMGDSHPAEKKVVLEFCPRDMPDLTEIQMDKLRKLVGPRWNPETDIVKMSCESHPTQVQNKRHLGDLVDNLLREARDDTDTFEDVPLDTRHHTFKPKPKFPEAWRMTEDRIKELARYREEAAMKDKRREILGKVVDGVKQIEEALSRRVEPARVAEPEMVMAGKGGKGQRGKKVAVRR